MSQCNVLQDYQPQMLMIVTAAYASEPISGDIMQNKLLLAKTQIPNLYGPFAWFALLAAFLRKHSILSLFLKTL